LRCQAFKQSVELIPRRHHDHLERLIGQVEEMHGMQLLVVAEAFARPHERGASQPHRASRLDEPVAQRLSLMALILMRERSDLESLRGAPVREM
jgi:hypothetical protein